MQPTFDPATLSIFSKILQFAILKLKVTGLEQNLDENGPIIRSLQKEEFGDDQINQRTKAHSIAKKLPLASICRVDLQKSLNCQLISRIQYFNRKIKLERFKNKICQVVKDRQSKYIKYQNKFETNQFVPLKITTQQFVQIVEKVFQAYEHKKVSNLFLVSLVQYIRRNSQVEEEIIYHSINHIINSRTYLKKIQNKNRKQMVIQINRNSFQLYRTMVRNTLLSTITLSHE